MFKTYENKLSNQNFAKEINFGKDFPYSEMLVIPRGFNSEYLKFMEQYDNVINYYNDYIPDTKRFKDEVIDKIETLKYVNVGKVKTDDWECNSHLFIINNHVFEYKTGMGINCQANKSDIYNYYKLIIECLHSIIQTSNITLNYSQDDFLLEFGYEDSVELYKKGILDYAEIKENAKKVIDIFGRDTVMNIYDIIQL